MILSVSRYCRPRYYTHWALTHYEDNSRHTHQTSRYVTVHATCHSSPQHQSSQFGRPWGLPAFSTFPGQVVRLNVLHLFISPTFSFYFAPLNYCCVVEFVANWSPSSVVSLTVVVTSSSFFLVPFLSYFVFAEKRGLCYPNYSKLWLGKPGTVHLTTAAPHHALLAPDYYDRDDSWWFCWFLVVGRCWRTSHTSRPPPEMIKYCRRGY